MLTSVPLSCQPPSSDLKIFVLACVYNVLQLYTSLINSATPCHAPLRLIDAAVAVVLRLCGSALTFKGELHKGNTLA